MEQPSMLDQLHALDEHVLADVVRQDQCCLDFILTSWQVERLSDKGIVNPDGLFRFRGTGFDPDQKENERTWTVVLKNLQAPPEEVDVTNIWYWKREFLAFQSGLLNELPEGGVKAPRFYGSFEQENRVWLWMEYIRDIDPPRWSLQRFTDAALRLGRLNGAYLNGRSLPGYPWLSRDQGITWTMDMSPEGVWDHPGVHQMFSPENLQRFRRLWKERERFFQAYHDLPQVFGHCDSGRRNHLFCLNSTGEEEMVSIDWAWCGIAPLGWDLTMLLPNSALLYEMEPEDLPGVEETAFPAYLEGLRSAGWQGDTRLVRLGYCVCSTLFPLLPSARGVTLWYGDETQTSILQMGCSYNEAAPGWRILNEYLLNLGEEALSLMEELAIGSVTA